MLVSFFQMRLKDSFQLLFFKMNIESTNLISLLDQKTYRSQVNTDSIQYVKDVFAVVFEKNSI